MVKVPAVGAPVKDLKTLPACGRKPLIAGPWPSVSQFSGTLIASLRAAHEPPSSMKTVLVAA